MSVQEKSFTQLFCLSFCPDKELSAVFPAARLSDLHVSAEANKHELLREHERTPRPPVNPLIISQSAALRFGPLGPFQKYNLKVL